MVITRSLQPEARDTEQTLVSVISPAATSLRSWTAAGLTVLHEAIFCDVKHRNINLIFFNKAKWGLRGVPLILL